MPPFGWKPRAKKSSFSAGRAILLSSTTAAGQCQIRSGMHPFGWKPLQPSLERSESHVTFNTTHRDSEQSSVSKTSSRPSSSVQKSEISQQQQNGGGVVSTQIGHAPVRLEAQGQTAV